SRLGGSGGGGFGAFGTRRRRPQGGEGGGGQAGGGADTIDMTGAGACAGQDQQTVLRQQLSQLVHEREDRVAAAVHDRAPADLHDLQPGQQADRAPARDRTREIAVQQRLARERGGDGLDGVGGLSHGGV